MNEERRFKAIVDDATVYFLKDFFENKTNFIDKCSNRFIKYDSEGGCDFDNKNLLLEDPTSQFRSNATRVIIILESPHKDEYLDGKNKLKQPICANGTTGNNLKECLSQLIDAMKLKGQNIDIAVINAIPYQCSQGVSTEVLRDFVWLKCWFEFGYNDTLDLLNKIKPDYIVNCCTKGCHFLPSASSHEVSKKYIEAVIDKTKIGNYDDIAYYEKEVGKKEYSLREFVNKCIKNYKNNDAGVTLYQCTKHPCRWDGEFTKDEFKELNVKSVEE
jgi:hypothetical protein